MKRSPFVRLSRARFALFGRALPLSDDWGYSRGQPIDRFYIDRFLSGNRDDIRGDVLEVKEPLYTRRYGRDVSRSDVVDIDAANAQATIVADLSERESLPEQHFDCIVFTQTLQYLGDLDAAVQNVGRALRPGGVLLVTAPGTNRADEDPRSPSLWSFTEAGCRRLLETEFGSANTDVRSYGNLLAAVAFLSGMARDELTAAELDMRDVRFPVVVAARAVRR
jgi:SAM-dependent methyltransferase